MGERYENIVLGPSYALTLGRLRDWHVMRAFCVRCPHVGYVHPLELRRSSYAEHVRLVDLEAKLRCTRCGNHEGNRWETCRLPRD